MVNWIGVTSLLYIASIHEFPSISIDFVLAFPPDGFYVDIFMGLPLIMAVNINIVEWVVKLNKSLYGIKKSSAN